MSENKTVFEQLEDVQKEIKDIKEKPKTLVEQLDENDPAIIEFVKNAKRIWRYCNGKADLRRTNNKNKKHCSFRLILLSIYLIVPFLFVTKPYGWILPIIATIVCMGQGILQVLKMKPREYELKYEEMPHFWKYAELDDNDIVSETKDKWWVVALRVSIFLIPIAIGVEMFLYLDGIWGLLGCLPMGLSSLSVLFFRDRTNYRYQLYFIDDKNEIEYYNLKDFMTRNGLK